MSVYIFGSFPQGFCLFPDDSNSEVIGKFKELSVAYSQLIIHRDNNLMYYGYTYQIEDGGIFGFCHVINNAMINDHQGLIDYFTGKVVSMAQSGELIQITERGVEPAVEFLSNDNNIWLIKHSLEEELDDESLFPKSPLPPTNYSLSKDSSITLTLEDSESKRIRASHTYGYTVIVRDNDDNRFNIQSFSNQLRELKESNKELKSRNTHLSHKKQNLLWVYLLSAIVIALIIALIVVFMNNKKNGGNNQTNNYTYTTSSTYSSNSEQYNYSGNDEMHHWVNQMLPALQQVRLYYDDLEDFSVSQLTYLRNAIFAIHGYRFKVDKFYNFFDQYDWYHPYYSDVSGQLSSIERHNISVIKDLEESSTRYQDNFEYYISVNK